jgi:hypothetical protein
MRKLGVAGQRQRRSPQLRAPRDRTGDLIWPGSVLGARRRVAVGIAQIAIEEPLVLAGRDGANRAGLRRYPVGLHRRWSAPA